MQHSDRSSDLVNSLMYEIVWFRQIKHYLQDKLYDAV